MLTHLFLSPEWIAAVHEIRAEYTDRAGNVDLEVAANVTVTNPPFGEGPVLGHIDATGPALTIEAGHLENPDFSVEIPYELAHRLFVDRDPLQVMPALMGGQIRLTGDSSKVLLLAGSMAVPPDENARVALAREVLHRIDSITS